MADEARRSWFARISRLASIGCITTILVLSWVPGSSRPTIGTSNLIEHFVAYFVTALVTIVAFVPPRTIRGVLAGMILLAGVAETGQNFVPGREPKVIDFLASSVGATTITCVVAILRRPKAAVRIPDRHTT